MSEPCPCPLCLQPSILDSYDEVDVGIGTIRGNELWHCPEHLHWTVLRRELDRRSHAFWFVDLEFTLLRPFPKPIFYTDFSLPFDHSRDGSD